MAIFLLVSFFVKITFSCVFAKNWNQLTNEIVNNRHLNVIICFSANKSQTQKQPQNCASFIWFCYCYFVDMAVVTSIDYTNREKYKCTTRFSLNKFLHRLWELKCLTIFLRFVCSGRIYSFAGTRIVFKMVKELSVFPS